MLSACQGCGMGKRAAGRLIGMPKMILFDIPCSKFRANGPSRRHEPLRIFLPTGLRFGIRQRQPLSLEARHRAPIERSSFRRLSNGSIVCGNDGLRADVAPRHVGSQRGAGSHRPCAERIGHRRACAIEPFHQASVRPEHATVGVGSRSTLGRDDGSVEWNCDEGSLLDG